MLGHSVCKLINAKRFMLTYNDPMEVIDHLDLCEHLTELLSENLEFLVVSKEKAPTTQMVHYHALLIAKEKIYKRDINFFDYKEIHPNIESVKGNPKKAYEYVIKDGNYWQSSLNYFKDVNEERIKERIKKNRLLLEGDVMEEFENGKIGAIDLIRASKIRTIKVQLNCNMNKRQAPLIMWFYGATGSGKTRKALEMAEELKLRLWISNDSLKWFDGYCGQEIAVLDDLRKDILPTWAFLLRLLDRYPLIVQIKGGFVKWVPRIIIITCPVAPEECFSWFNKNGEQQQWDRQEQLNRRLTWEEVEQIYEFPLSLGDQEEINLTIENWKLKEMNNFI